jgi:hypothetical protein
MNIIISKIAIHMNFKILYIKQTLLLILLISCFQQKALSQGTDISSSKSTSLYVGLNLCPARSNISNTEIASVSNMSSGKKGSFSGFIEFGYFLSNNFGLSSGLGYSSNGASLTLKSYQSNYTTTDTESESYQRRVTGSNITETQKIGFLTVPLFVDLRVPLNQTIGFFIQPGMNLEIPLTKSYTSSGIFSFEGYYPAYNVLLSDIPAHGFPMNKSITTNGSLELKSLGFNFIVAAGIDFFIMDKIQLAAAICYEKSLSNLSAYASSDKFQLSTDADQINSLMGGSSKTTIQSIGLRISFRYYLK